MSYTAPKYVSVRYPRQNFVPGPGLPTVTADGTYITDQDTLDSVIEVAFSNGIYVVVSDTAPNGTGPPFSDDVQARIDAALAGIETQLGTFVPPTRLGIDQDGKPYFSPFGIALDTDGTPYFDIPAQAARLLIDTDGQPYFEVVS